MFASVNNSTDPTTGQITGYISNSGIPSIANQTIQELDVVTPYRVFPVTLLNNAVGLAWWKNMADGKKMQSMSFSSNFSSVLSSVCFLNASSLTNQQSKRPIWEHRICSYRWHGNLVIRFLAQQDYNCQCDPRWSARYC